ncbi:hypothetical protein B4N89_20740 [Embleya scabrispora]|uniref:Uncharacterized protein n=1 Tax=Embleya scabrispora TaxID=159449 RepID=A0A1T3P270_9ACTN|nr:hypothetical protein [Embleya scabrispora]OPC83042.1 hypothetical protein B4N89_20740 [Embleya scabrispora]
MPRTPDSHRRPPTPAELDLADAITAAIEDLTSREPAWLAVAVVRAAVDQGWTPPTTQERIADAIQARGDELRESGGELSSREIRDAYHDAARMVRDAAATTTHGRSPADHPTETPR